MNQPLVSVNVLMYNSSKYIIETLESIKAQTYPNIELIMSDDKSTDNTVQICEKWIAKNKSRFVSYQILVSKHNSGQSGNYNRAFRAATGEWIKEIDGDDLLLPNCLEDLINYTQQNASIKYVFGKIVGFGADKKTINKILKWFDYSFFDLTKEEQYHQLIYKGNCIPSPSSFYNRQYIKDINFVHDERIPYMEDWPKWINLLRCGVKFYFMPINIVAYRIGSGISTNFSNENFFRTNALMRAYYCYPEWYKDDGERAATLIADKEVEIIKQYQKYINELRNSISFKIGLWVTAPFRFIQKKF